MPTPSTQGLAASVVIATRGRPLRLRWLLNALLEQDCDPGLFEVVVAHDPSSSDTARVLAKHPLHAQGRLRGVPFPEGNSLAAGRNAAWQAARAPLILFTNDDCRPARDWVTSALAAAKGTDGAVLQGRTLPDPQEGTTLSGAPWTRTGHADPPTPWAESCNVAYPRRLLDQVGGFQPEMRMGEDTDLWLRTQQAGAELVAVPQMLVYHAVHAEGLLRAMRSTWRWRDIAWLAKRHPGVRRHMWGWIWWKREHAALSCAMCGLVLARSRPRWALLVVPWVALAAR